MLKASERHGYDGMMHSERQVIPGVQQDETVNVSDRCSAVTKEGQVVLTARGRTVAGGRVLQPALQLSKLTGDDIDTNSFVPATVRSPSSGNPSVLTRTPPTMKSFPAPTSCGYTSTASAHPFLVA